jgi:predicted RecA/RadA family phage recombinase
MRNYRQEGETIPVAAPANVKSGDGVLVGSIFGVATFDAASGDPVEITTVGVFDLPKPDSVISFSQGSLVYWDLSESECTSTAASNYKIGSAIADAAATDGLVRVRLNGVSVVAEAGGG